MAKKFDILAITASQLDEYFLRADRNISKKNKIKNEEKIK